MLDLPITTDLHGKTAVVTGAGGVLCSMFARAVAQCGASVALLDIDLNAAEEVAAQIRADGFQAKAYRADVLDRASLEAAHAAVTADFGSCGILINGAGGNNPRATADIEFQDEAAADVKSFFDLDKDGVAFVFDLNFLGTLLPTQVFAKDLLALAGGSILNISSMNAFRPLTKIPAYSAAKAAISNFTQWLAVYFAHSNIRVNAMAPGFFVGKQNKALLFDENGVPTPRTEKILRNTPMSRFGEMEELLGTLLFLLNEKAAGFITGVVIPVDGGFSAFSGV